MITCSRHAGERAAWRCENCQRTLCPDCAARSGLANTTAVLCVHCGGLAQTLMVPRPRRPYWQMFPTFLKAIRGAGIHPALPVRLELRLAGFLEQVGQYEEAVISCQRAAKDKMEGPFAARAIFTAARLLSEKLGNPARGVELYRHVSDNFPQDELSMYAADAVRKLERSYSGFRNR